MHLTPLLEQYQKIKNKYKDVLLLFRVGDFYEFYYEDAKQASSYLGITLTSKTISKGVRVPLAGVPIKAADGYIAKLVKHGLKVAICEQLEPATKGKKLVARDVIEVITPGTILRPSLLDSTRTVFLAACLPDDSLTGVAFCDLTSGEFSCGEVPSDQLSEILLRREVKEVVIPEGVEIKVEQTLTTIEEISADTRQAGDILRAMEVDPKNQLTREAVDELTTITTRIDNRLGEVQSTAQGVRNEVNVLQDNLAARKSRLLLIYNLVALAVTLLMLWLIYSQIVVLRRHLDLFRAADAKAKPAAGI